jgi:hypothetical protein
VIEWISSLLTLRDDSICKKLDELEFPKIIICLMKEYDTNSFLHFKIYNVFNEAIQMDMPIYLETVFVSANI